MLWQTEYFSSQCKYWFDILQHCFGSGGKNESANAMWHGIFLLHDTDGCTSLIPITKPLRLNKDALDHFYPPANKSTKNPPSFHPVSKLPHLTNPSGPGWYRRPLASACKIERRLPRLCIIVWLTLLMEGYLTGVVAADASMPSGVVKRWQEINWTPLR